ncbi:hypothetical protein POVWA1_003390 [Plasmodium ovale wallikeri]|uniref:Uncharacterized protein n=1 Tax=Plasmodium ovale wallikeri TaxID=864142 RepID=A0A1A8YGM8_PLAOA|nr:hypothetical protein POVWA1_003390 [Plasmodium ovale wallikeri]
MKCTPQGKKKKKKKKKSCNMCNDGLASEAELQKRLKNGQSWWHKKGAHACFLQVLLYAEKYSLQRVNHGLHKIKDKPNLSQRLWGETLPYGYNARHIIRGEKRLTKILHECPYMHTAPGHINVCQTYLHHGAPVSPPWVGIS